MGLDISAYSKLIEAPDAERDSDNKLVDFDNYREFYFNSDFPGRENGLKTGMAYKLGDESHGFRAGSYGGYSVWRNELAKMAGYPAIAPTGDDYSDRFPHAAKAWEDGKGPFFEQIQFSDCDGTIGPVVSAKLAKDYADNAAKAEQIGGRFWDLYQEWLKAFTVAADGGAVSFH